MPNSLLDRFLSNFRNIWFLWVLVLLLNIITFLLIYYKIHPTNQTVALHYNVLVGVEWYGQGYNLYLIPGVGLTLSAADFILFRYLKRRQILLSFLSPFIALCVQTILLGSTLFLIRVN